jgi:hypothetical protein
LELAGTRECKDDTAALLGPPSETEAEIQCALHVTIPKHSTNVIHIEHNEHNQGSPAVPALVEQAEYATFAAPAD